MPSMRRRRWDRPAVAPGGPAALQRFGHAEMWTTTAIHARTMSPKTGAESGTGRIHRPAADEHQKSATLAANRTAALRSSRAQTPRPVAARREGERPNMAGPAWQA